MPAAKATKITSHKAISAKTMPKTMPKPVGKKKESAPAARPSPPSLRGIAPYVAKKDEKYMNKKQQDHFRTLLNAWKQELLTEVSRTVHAMQDDTANHPDPNDRASQETDMGLELRSRDRERKLIRKIDEATAMIDSGDYGYCESCGDEIGVQRLEARPTATLCIECKTLDEIREKQMG